MADPRTGSSESCHTAAPAEAQPNGVAHGGPTKSKVNGLNGSKPTEPQQQAEAQLPSQARPRPPLRFPDICYKLRRKVLAFLDADHHEDELLRAVQSQVRISVDVIEQALKRYGLDELSLSYNGGKDCLVLLILLLACLPTYADAVADDALPDSSACDNTISDAGAATPTPPLQAIYIVPPDPFPEVDAFVETSTREYHLDLARYALPMRAALDAYMGHRPAVRAIFMGTRRTDPHGEFLDHFTPTDAGWPQLMRIHPVLDWHYAEIWGFIRHLDIPFCKLYNQGFTSLGGTTDTRPNPALAKAGDGTSFRPAYELTADNEERLGRGR